MHVIQTALTLFRRLLIRESGQDLVEYSLVLAMVALGSISGMGTLAAGLNDVFSSVGSTLTANV
ncbi:Flp family type IVb pilin [Occallatibacter savannae]|uniref:Flp family type IVb pilin n=1 Tax=Occallatibacter savannae TaxID=1002691 RepID=UPI000D6934FA|nr:Flp family type IVb pilin [Occallatibacter savannae]